MRKNAVSRGRKARASLKALWLTVALAAAPGFAAASAPGGGSLREGEEVEPPRAFSELCARRPEICPERSLARELEPLRRSMLAMMGPGALAPAAVRLTEQRMAQLRAVNHAANATIRPVADRGADLWSVTSMAGDCEEYVLAKLNLLAGLGWPRSAMRITVVRDAQGYHAILVVETDRGGFVLDNMATDVSPVSQSPYEFVVAQSVYRPGAWVRVAR